MHSGHAQEADIKQFDIIHMLMMIIYPNEIGSLMLDILQMRAFFRSYSLCTTL